MNKPEIVKGSFSVDDIHRVREHHAEITKNMSSEERINYINSEAEKVRARIRKCKKRKSSLVNR